MDKEAVGMARETVERAVREAGGIVHRDGNIFFTDYRQMQAAMALAQQPAAQAAGLMDGDCGTLHIAIDLAESMGNAALADGLRSLLSRAAPSGEPVYQCMCTDDDDGREDIWMDVPRETFEQLSKRSDVRSRILYAAPQPAAQQAEPESPMKAAADALRRKTELEQAHQDGYRDGFKAAQAMLAKAEQPAEEARGVVEALHYLRMGMENLRLGNGVHMLDFGQAERILSALLAAPAAGTASEGQDADLFWNDEDAESSHESIEDLIVYFEPRIGETLTIQRAVSLPKIKVRVTGEDEDGYPTYEVVGDAALAASRKGEA